MFLIMANAKNNLRVFALKMVGRNPYKERTMGSYQWKAQKGLPLSKEEESFQEMFIGHLSGLSRLRRAHAEFEATSAWVVLIDRLTDNLPPPIRERFMRLTLPEARNEVDELLRLSELQRGQKTTTLADRAWKIGLMVFLVSVVTLLVSVGTLCKSFVEKT